jgi:hypothetical protein
MKAGDTQQRGPIGHVPHARATCECAHGMWVEGDRFEPEGRACRDVREWIESAERKERFGG